MADQHRTIIPTKVIACRHQHSAPQGALLLTCDAISASVAFTGRQRQTARGHPSGTHPGGPCELLVRLSVPPEQVNAPPGSVTSFDRRRWRAGRLQRGACLPRECSQVEWATRPARISAPKVAARVVHPALA